MPAQQKQQSSLFPSNGPSTPRAAGTNSLICLWEQSCASNDRPAINRFSVSRLSPRQPHDPKVFPRSNSTSSRRKGTIKQICSRSPSATCPRSSVSRERCTNVWFKKTVPRSLRALPSLYSQVGLHSSASPSRPALSISARAFDPSRSCGCSTPRFPASVATPCRRIRRISCRHRLPISYSAALAAGAFSCRQLVIVPVTSKRQGDTTNSTPSQHRR